MPPTEDSLQEDAEFGKLPFDIFALEKWDYSRPVGQDQDQWNDLALEWLHLDARGRHSYHQVPGSREVAATPDQMRRVLLPHQTVHERNLSLQTNQGRHSPVWLRTCYAPELAHVYADWMTGLDSSILRQSQILDDEALYAPLADNWSGVLLRVPAIADTVRYYYETDGVMDDIGQYYDPPSEDEEFKRPLYEAMLKEKTLMFLVDEEALRTNLIKILWLDIHGACVWENKLPPDMMLTFRGRMFDGGSLADLTEGLEGYVGETSMYTSGAVLEID